MLTAELAKRCDDMICNDLRKLPGYRIVEFDSGFISQRNYDYRIPRPLSFQTVRKKLNGTVNASKADSYKTINEFLIDVRTIFGNFVWFNYHPTSHNLRRDVCRVLFQFETSWFKILEEVVKIDGNLTKAVRQPLPELKACLAAFDDMVKVPPIGVPESEKKYTIDDFIDRIESYLRDDSLREYKRIVKSPICFGEIISKLIVCDYKDYSSLIADVDYLVKNCATFWSVDRGGNGGGPDNIYIKDAEKLRSVFVERLRFHTAEMQKKNNLLKQLQVVPTIEMPAQKPPSTSSKKNHSSSAVVKSGSAGASLSSSSVDDTAIVFDNSAAKAMYNGDAKRPSSKAVAKPTAATNSKGSTSSSKVKKEKGEVPGSAISMMPPIAAVATPAASSSSSSSSASVLAAAAAAAKRAEKYLKAAIKTCILKVKDHFMINAVTGFRVSTSFPFQRSVDPVLYPDYAIVVTNPMDLARMEKKLNSDKYSTVEVAIADVELIKNNAYTYNTGVQGLEVRIMADALCNYFKYLLKSCMKVLHSSGDTAVVDIILSAEARSCLKFDSAEITKDVTDYLNHIGLNGEDVVGRENLRGLLSVKDLKNSGQQVSDLKLVLNPAKKAKTKGNDPALSAIGDVKIPPPTKVVLAPLPITEGSSNVKPLIGSSELSDVLSVSSPKSGKSSTGNKKRKWAEPKLTEEIESFWNKDVAGDFPLGPLPEDTEPLPLQPEWKAAADSVLQQICRHPYVDRTKSATVIVDFISPVPLQPVAVTEQPAESHGKKKAGKKSTETVWQEPPPLDLTTLLHRLESFMIKDAEEFFDMLVGVFVNAMQLIQKSPLLKHLVKRLEHLIVYVKWLCLEVLPHSGTDEAPAQPGMELTAARRQEYRQRRIEILKAARILDSGTGSAPYAECKKLLKDVERCRTNQDRTQLSYFVYPVNLQQLSDYSVYVRNPIDLSTIKYKLDGTLPSVQAILDLLNKQSPRYIYYGDFVDDVKRVFTNALKYNKEHLLTDTTNTSQMIYDAAEIFSARVDSLIPLFTVSLADRLERLNLAKEEKEEFAEVGRKEEAKQQQEEKQFEQKLIEDLKKEDEAFAKDLDVERKKRETAQQIQIHKQNQLKKLLVPGSNIHNVEDLSDYSDERSGDTSPEWKAPTVAKAKPCVPLVFGFGILGMPPFRFVPLIERKIQTAAKARDFWSFLCVKGPSATPHHDQSHTHQPNPGDERRHNHKSKAMAIGSSATGDIPASVSKDYGQKSLKLATAAENYDVTSSLTISSRQSESIALTLPVSMKFEVKKNLSKRKRLDIFQDDYY